jgi:hypothetical protein
MPVVETVNEVDSLPTAATPVQRQRALQEASEQYLLGQLDVGQFECIESEFMSDYRSAILALAQRKASERDMRSHQRRIDRMQRYLRFLRLHRQAFPSRDHK